jgi:hypothetical protein
MFCLTYNVLIRIINKEPFSGSPQRLLAFPGGVAQMVRAWDS